MALPAVQWLVGEEAIMGTAVRVELAHADRTAGQAAIAAVMQEMHRIDRAMSPFKPESELSRINREAARGPVPISREMLELIRRSIEFSMLSDGAFDITFSAVGCLYDYRAGVKPTAAQVAQTLPGINYRHIELDEARCTVAFHHPQTCIDLGGIAKGHAVDCCIELLRAAGVTAAMVSAGGDSRVLGSRNGRPWVIGIRDPRKPERIVAKLPLVDAAISTSGDYERYFEEEGVRHHHILDPTTGRSPGGVHSVTVIGPDATTTEGLSKTVFIKGVQKGLSLIDSLNGPDAVVVDAEGKLYYSSGLRHQDSAVRRE